MHAHGAQGQRVWRSAFASMHACLRGFAASCGANASWVLAACLSPRAWSILPPSLLSRCSGVRGDNGMHASVRHYMLDAACGQRNTGKACIHASRVPHVLIAPPCRVIRPACTCGQLQGGQSSDEGALSRHDMRLLYAAAHAFVLPTRCVCAHTRRRIVCVRTRHARARVAVRPCMRCWTLAEHLEHSGRVPRVPQEITGNQARVPWHAHSGTRTLG
jgi:hypothetical protein